MKMNVLVTAAALSDRDLLCTLGALAARERDATVELVAHLAALDARPPLYAAEGYSSVFTYCTRALRLSEDAACNRVAAARACQRFPVILDLLAAGSLTLTAVRLLARHLTPENHEAVLDRARGRSVREIEALAAHLAPRPDVPSTVRKLPSPAPSPPPLPMPAAAALPSEAPPPLHAPAQAAERPLVQATAPERYRVQFTIRQETHDKLRRLQALLRREVPDGDPGAIFDRALTLLLARVERDKLGQTARPARPSIRFATDKAPTPASRRVPRAVRRAVWKRDGDQCAFVSAGGERCTERTFLELHHIQPYAKGGPATVENIALRCWRHNQHEAQLVFGPRDAARGRPARA
jgi:5-methylcytosine-specific restriction endonuclease McrA